MIYKKILNKINIEEVKKEITSKVNGLEQQVLIYAKFVNKKTKEKKAIPHMLSLYNNNDKEEDYMIFRNKFYTLITGLNINDSFEYFKENFNDWYGINYVFNGVTPEDVYYNLEKPITDSVFTIVEFPDYRDQVDDDDMVETYAEAIWEYEYDNLLVIDDEKTDDILVKPRHYYGVVNFDRKEYNELHPHFEGGCITQEVATATTKSLIETFFVEVEALIKSGEWIFIQLEYLVSQTEIVAGLTSEQFNCINEMLQTLKTLHSFQEQKRKLTKTLYLNNETINFIKSIDYNDKLDNFTLISNELEEERNFIKKQIEINESKLSETITKCTDSTTTELSKIVLMCSTMKK